MTYLTITRLTNDGPFIERLDACLTQESTVFKDDGRPDIANLAYAILRGDGGVMRTFIDMAAAAPGFAEQAEAPNGQVDSSQITDGDILSNVQANYPTVASIYFNSDGTPKT